MGPSDRENTSVSRSISSVLNRYGDWHLSKMVRFVLTRHERMFRPRGVQVVKTKEERMVLVNREQLAEILLQSSIADLEVVVISVAGVFRNGKSFLLNFFIKYLEARERERTEHPDWLGGDEPLEGFEWRSGCDSVTTGIHIYSKVFKVEDHYGKEIAVVLMDTQGTFDLTANHGTTTSIFALSTLLSSVQIYNVRSRMQRDDFQNLGHFINYAIISKQQGRQLDFQSLIFLIRDWSSPQSFQFGAAGGALYLNKCINDSGTSSEVKRVMDSVDSSYENVSCVLLPFPGVQAAFDRENNFNGRVQDLDPYFLKDLQTFIEETVFGPPSFAVKKVNGEPVTCRGLFEYFKSYTDIFRTANLPEPQSMFDALVTGYNNSLVEDCFALYLKEMEKECMSFLPIKYHWNVNKSHNRAQEKAGAKFDQATKLGGEDEIARLTEAYIGKVTNKYNQCKEQMETVDANVKEGVEVAVSVAAAIGTLFGVKVLAQLKQ